MAGKARRRPSWKKRNNVFTKEVYQKTIVIYGEDIEQCIQYEIDRELLEHIRLSEIQ